MTTSNMKLDLPIVNVTVGPAYATLVNEAFEDIDVHDHTANKGKQIPTAGLNMDGTLEFNNNFITELKASKYQDQTSSLSTTDDRRGIYSLNGELTYIDGNGNEIGITSGGSVNTSGSGNITGLGGTTAALTYNNTSKSFIFTQSGGVAAHIQAGDIIMQESGGSDTLTLTAPTITSNYTLTFPAAQPAANDSYMRIATDGTIAYGTLTLTGLNYITLNQGTGVFTLAQIDGNDDIAQDGATTGQTLRWDGAGWAPQENTKTEANSSTATAVASSGTLTFPAGKRDAATYVAGSGGAVTGVLLSAGEYNGQQWTLIGTSDTNTVGINYAAGSKEINGDIVLGIDDVLTLRWDATGTAWIEQSRNN